MSEELTKEGGIDRHVGARLRLRRTELRLSQSALAKRLGVTFQAVQKYEAGSVRISVARLYDAARALAVRPSFFFDGYGEAHAAPAHALERRDVAALLTDYSSIRDPNLQADIRRLVAMLGQQSG